MNPSCELTMNVCPIATPPWTKGADGMCRWLASLMGVLGGSAHCRLYWSVPGVPIALSDDISLHSKLCGLDGHIRWRLRVLDQLAQSMLKVLNEEPNSVFTAADMQTRLAALRLQKADGAIDAGKLATAVEALDLANAIKRLRNLKQTVSNKSKLVAAEARLGTVKSDPAISKLLAAEVYKLRSGPPVVIKRP